MPRMGIPSSNLGSHFGAPSSYTLAGPPVNIIPWDSFPYFIKCSHKAQPHVYICFSYSSGQKLIILAPEVHYQYHFLLPFYTLHSSVGPRHSSWLCKYFRYSCSLVPPCYAHIMGWLSEACSGNTRKLRVFSQLFDGSARTTTRISGRPPIDKWSRPLIRYSAFDLRNAFASS